MCYALPCGPPVIQLINQDAERSGSVHLLAGGKSKDPEKQSSHVAFNILEYLCPPPENQVARDWVLSLNVLRSVAHPTYLSVSQSSLFFMLQDSKWLFCLHAFSSAPPTTQDTAQVSPDPADSLTSASLTLNWPEVTGIPLSLISAGQGVDTATSIPSSTGPKISINRLPHPQLHQMLTQAQLPNPVPAQLGRPGSPINPISPTPTPIIILKPASSADPNTNTAASLDPNTNPSAPPPPPITPSLILVESVRCDVHSILKDFQRNLNCQKFKQAHLAVHTFINCQAKSMHKETPPPELPYLISSSFDSSGHHIITIT
ncbi:hypothetical protein KEM48_002473 [Puccinia striiformis f. sp. tritici PST-130]|nr:hypothetical protein KEM48_002473 [Puccinia striiformis f. sp. tritici PST-130]